MEQAVEQRPVFQKEFTEIFIDRENAMTVRNIDQFEGHTGSAVHGIFISTRGAKTAVTAERDEFKFSTVRTAIHGTTERRITTVDHFFNIFHLSFSGMKSIFNFFIIVGKNFL
jgi:hypothetical protein